MAPLLSPVAGCHAATPRPGDARSDPGTGPVHAASADSGEAPAVRLSAPDLAPILNARLTDTLIITGAETDVCVLATVLGAVDRGYRVIVVEDALCSSSDAGHDALMTLYRERFAEQIETISSGDLIDVIRDAPLASKPLN